MLFQANLPDNYISFEPPTEGAPLKVRLLAVVPNISLPLRDNQGVAVESFSATEELLRGAALTSLCGLLTVNHNDPLTSKIGIWDKIFYENGLVVEGSVLCPRWVDRISKGEFSGISVEGNIEGEMKNPTKMDIYAVSFLDTSEGACPLVDENNNSVCKVDIMIDDNDETNIEAAWSGPNAEKGIWSYATDKDGNVIPSKAKKCFLKVEGDPKLKESYSYPYVTIQNGSPVPSRDALISALKYASGARGAAKDSSVIRKIKTVMNRESMDLPPSLQARLEQKSVIENGQNKITASLFDPATDELLDSKELIIINDLHVKGVVEMSEKEEIKVEASASVTEPVVEVKVEAEVKASSPELVTEPEVLVAAPVVEVAPSEVPISEPKALDWEQVSKTLGIKSVEEFTQLKTAADKAKEIESRLDSIIKENEGLKSFKVESEKKWLKNTLPPALWDKDGKLDALHAEMSADPISFNMKYTDDIQRFAASKNVTLQGSAVESVETEKVRKMQARKTRKDQFLAATGGPIRR